MKRAFALIAIVAVLVAGVAQQNNTPATTTQQDAQQATKSEQPKQAQQQQAQQKPQKPGTLSAQGDPLNFFARGEGTLVVRGRGYFVLNTVQGKIQIEGFQEVKQLPRGVRIKPPLNQRLKVYMGQGTLRIEGKFDSVRAVMRKAQIEFKGVAAFNMQGTGTATVDGLKRELTPISAFTLLVPAPDWYRNPAPEDEATPVKGGTKRVNPEQR